MTVDEDGRVRLSDRKSGKRSEVQADRGGARPTSSSTIDAIPSHRWHGLGGAVLRRMLPRSHEAMRFQIAVGPRRIGGASGSTEADLAPLLAQLDELLARAVREGRPGTRERAAPRVR